MAKKSIFWPEWLIDNPLIKDPNDFIFSVKSNPMLTTEDITPQLIAESTEFKFETLIDILNRGDRIICNALVGPLFSKVTAHWTGEVNTLLTPNEDVISKGGNLRIEGDKEDIGIRFVLVDDESVTAVELYRLSVNNTSTLQFHISHSPPAIIGWKSPSNTATELCSSKSPVLSVSIRC